MEEKAKPSSAGGRTDAWTEEADLDGYSAFGGSVPSEWPRNERGRNGDDDATAGEGEGRNGKTWADLIRHF